MAPWVTSPVAGLLEALQVGGGLGGGRGRGGGGRGVRGQHGAQAVLGVDAEEHGRLLQHQPLQPCGGGPLQVLLVHQAHDDHRLGQADHEQRHAHHEVHACEAQGGGGGEEEEEGGSG